MPILERYKLDDLVLVLWFILYYCVVFMHNPSFWHPNWDEKSQLGRKVPIGTPMSIVVNTTMLQFKLIYSAYLAAQIQSIETYLVEALRVSLQNKLLPHNSC